MSSASAAERFSRPWGLFVLWFGVLGAPLIWALRIGASYILVPYACWMDWVGMLHLVTLAGLVGTAFAGWVAWRSWRKTGASGEVEGWGPLPRSRFLALFGVLGSAFFFLVIAAEGIAVFYIHPCVTGGVPVGWIS